MSLLPILFGDAFMDSSRFINQHFGMPIGMENFFAPAMMSRYYRPWRTVASASDAGSTISCDSDKFQVNLDVQQFKPSEITVKVTGSNQIKVEGKHEEKEDEHGFISRHFVRTYRIPDGRDVEKIICKLSLDGVLTIAAPATQVEAMETREIPIEQTGAPSVEHKKN